MITKDFKDFSSVKEMVSMCVRMCVCVRACPIPWRRKNQMGRRCEAYDLTRAGLHLHVIISFQNKMICIIVSFCFRFCFLIM